MDFDIQVDRNLKGIELEKDGNVDQAIILYERNINENFVGNHPYDRLAIIYRKRKQFDDEVRILEKAIEIFEKITSSPKKFKKRDLKFDTSNQHNQRHNYMQHDICREMGYHG